MTSDVLDIATSLTAVMRDETEALGSGDWPSDIAALAAAKARLVGSLEAAFAEQQRTEPMPDSLSEERRNELGGAIRELQLVAASNAAMLRRQIALSRELLGEIALEAQRLSGMRQQTYRRCGGILRRDDPTPVSINTSL